MSKINYPETPKSWGHFHRGRKYTRKSLRAEENGILSLAAYYQSMMVKYYALAGVPGLEWLSSKR